jgi:SAM-dependent methyltransferase
MARLEAWLRRIVPSVAALSRNRLLMWPLDLIDRPLTHALGLAGLPPNRLRLRVGAGSRILLNQVQHVRQPVNFWLAAFAAGHVRLDSRILDLGCGCGRYAAPLRDFSFFGDCFRGHYAGADVDAEALRWCREHFPGDRFSFQQARAYSGVYHPRGERDAVLELDLEGGSRDFAFSISLLTHLLEREAADCLREVHRVLAPGAMMLMTAFCIDHLEGRSGGRWSFRHRLGNAYVESRRYPEAAVAFSSDWLLAQCAACGFAGAELRRGGGQSLLLARKP